MEHDVLEKLLLLQIMGFVALVLLLIVKLPLSVCLINLIWLMLSKRARWDSDPRISIYTGYFLTLFGLIFFEKFSFSYCKCNTSWGASQEVWFDRRIIWRKKLLKFLGKYYVIFVLKIANHDPRSAYGYVATDPTFSLDPILWQKTVTKSQ
jgi:hypothetical protein